MWHLVGLLAIPCAIAGIAAYKFKATITLQEFALMLGLACTVAVGGFFLARWGAMQDIEHWNGRITAKDHGSQKCCHCRQVCDTCPSKDSQGRTTTTSCNCREVCSHSSDYYWSLEVSTGDDVSIARCESNPFNVPSAWTKAYVGEPASVPHTYTNYLLADPDSLLMSVADESLLARVPAAIPQVHSFYKVDKVVSDGVRIPPGWQQGLLEMNADLGKGKQVDVILVVTDNPDPTYAQAVEAKWLYGPKNAVIIVVGVPFDSPTFEWVRVVSISKVESLKVALRDGLKGKRLDDPEGGVAFIRQAIMSKFERTPLAEWEYLASAATPSTWVLVLLYILVTGGTIGLAVWMHREDVFARFGRRRSSGFTFGRRRW